MIASNLEGALLGDHVCQKEVIVSKEVPKWELRKQTIRTYQWCMSVPPRCSVYSTKLVNESRISVINVTASIETCCEGFKEQNNVCISICGHCQNGLCYKGNCICRTGWDGPNCDYPLVPIIQPTTTTTLNVSTTLIPHHYRELNFHTEQATVPFTTLPATFKEYESEFTTSKDTVEDIFSPKATVAKDLPLNTTPTMEDYANVELEGSGSILISTLPAEAPVTLSKGSSLESARFDEGEDPNLFQDLAELSTENPISVLMKPITKRHEEENAILKESVMGERYEKRASVENLTQNTKLSVNEAPNQLLIYSICAASLVSFLVLVIAITLYAVRASRKKIDTPKRSNQDVATVAVYTSSIFHSPLPDPPVFDNPTYLSIKSRESQATQLEDSLEVQQFDLAYLKQAKHPKIERVQYLYDHPPSTGSYRASSEVDTLSQYNFSQKSLPVSGLEPVYDEIPSTMDPLEPQKGSTKSADSNCLYMNTCGRTKF